MVYSWTRNLVYLIRYIPIGLIAAYQYLVSPLLGPSCRFYPTCSSYAREAMQKHGFLKGGRLSLQRLFKCHPMHPGGYDPLP